MYTIFSYVKNLALLYLLLSHVTYMCGWYIIEREPEFVVEPRDTVVAQNSDVLFQCKVSGKPQPVVVWKKIDGQIPAERFRFSVSPSLRYLPKKTDVDTIR